MKYKKKYRGRKRTYRKRTKRRHHKKRSEFAKGGKAINRICRVIRKQPWNQLPYCPGLCSFANRTFSNLMNTTVKVAVLVNGHFGHTLTLGDFFTPYSLTWTDQFYTAQINSLSVTLKICGTVQLATNCYTSTNVPVDMSGNGLDLWAGGLNNPLQMSGIQGVDVTTTAGRLACLSTKIYHKLQPNGKPLTVFKWINSAAFKNVAVDWSSADLPGTYLQTAFLGGMAHDNSPWAWDVIWPDAAQYFRQDGTSSNTTIDISVVSSINCTFKYRTPVDV